VNVTRPVDQPHCVADEKLERGDAQRFDGVVAGTQNALIRQVKTAGTDDHAGRIEFKAVGSGVGPKAEAGDPGLRSDV
jgi:hypothetical protein